MGNYVYRLHNSNDDKLYNIKQGGAFPTVIFGRTIKQDAVPGNEYYFRDGRVKFIDTDTPTGNIWVKPFPIDSDNPNHWGVPCIFKVPENFDWAQRTDVDYVKQFCRTAKTLNANTTSPNYIIRRGEIFCVKPYGTNGKACIIRKRKKHKNGNTTIKFVRNFNNKNQAPSTNNYPNRIVLSPIGRIKNKLSIFRYNFVKVICGFAYDPDYGEVKAKWKYKMK